MDEIREIVTKAVIAKGKKIVKVKDSVNPNPGLFNILGCWIINNCFTGELVEPNVVKVEGTAEIDIWASFDDNTSTEVIRKNITYSECIKTRKVVKDVCNDDLQVRLSVLTPPNCTNVAIDGENIVFEVQFEVICEIIGETKVAICVISQVDDYDCDFENEINENFITENEV